MPRPRKAGPREPNGQPQRSQKTAHLQRELDAIRLLSTDPYLESPIGVLLFRKEISLPQYDAAKWFHEARVRADSALSLPPRTVPAQDIGRVRGLSGDEEDPVAKRKAIDVYDRAVAYIGHGSRELAALELVAVYQRRPDTYEQLLALKSALAKLVLFRSGRRAA